MDEFFPKYIIPENYQADEKIDTILEQIIKHSVEFSHCYLIWFLNAIKSLDD